MLSWILFFILVTLLTNPSEGFTCTAQGRFQNVYDPTCKTYYLCVKDSQIITSTLYKCPNTFDPSTNECSDSYVCKKHSHCTGSGYIPDLSDTSCLKYYNCYSFFGFYLPLAHYCAQGYQFDPIKKFCSKTYKCEDYLLAPIEEINPSPSPLIEEFVCNQMGLFPDKLDKTCSAYFYCTPIGGGKFLKRPYKCPKYFDPELKQCTTNYKCPYEAEINVEGDNIEITTNKDVGQESVTTSTKPTIMEDITKTDELDFTEPTTTELFAEEETTNIEKVTESETIITEIETEVVSNGEIYKETSLNPEETETGILEESVTMEIDTTLDEETTTIMNESTVVSNQVDDEIIFELETTKSETVTAINKESTFEPITESESEILTDFTPIESNSSTPKNIEEITEVSTQRTIEEVGTTPHEETTILDESTITSNHGDKEIIFEPEIIESETITEVGNENTFESITENESEILTDFTPTESNSSTQKNIEEITEVSTQKNTEEVDTIPHEETTILDESTITSNHGDKEIIFESEIIESETVTELTNENTFESITQSESEILTDFTPMEFNQSTQKNIEEITELPSEETTIEIDTTPQVESESIADLTGNEIIIEPENTETTINTELSITETTNPIEVTLQPTEEFICNTVGRFPNDTDKTCSQYILCSKLHNGKFIKTPYKCPKGTYFDPETTTCSKSYQCPLTTTTNESTDYTKLPTKETTEDVQTTINYTELPTQEITDEGEIPTQPNEEFTCEVEGSFPNYTDKSCSRYFVCKELPNGKIVKTPSKCAKGTYFDPERETCSEIYQCPFSTTTHETSFTESIDTISQPIEEFICTNVGRFPNDTDETCSQYILCSQLHNGKFIKTPYKCPKGTYFDPETTTCSKSYQCPLTITTNENADYTQHPTQETTKDVQTTINYTEFPIEEITEEAEIPTQSIEEFTCEVEGSFPNYTDKSCSRYFVCKELSNGKFVKTPSKCAKGTYFDPERETCSEIYQCPFSTTTHESSFTESIDTTSQPIEEFICTDVGRFLNDTDKTCSHYVLCSQLHNGKFIKTPYKCPKGTYFDPETTTCSKSYQCPFTSTTNESTDYTNLPMQETTEDVQTTINYTEFPTQEITEEAEIPTQSIEEFICEVVGSFPNYTDKSCSRYFICKELPNGKFVKTPSKCTKGTYFDPEISKCSETYQCPFIITTDESTTFTEISTQETMENQQTTENVETTLNYTEPPKEETTESAEITLQPTEEFTCEVVGSFPNYTDKSCSRYFICKELPNGKFVKTPSKCTKGTYFDPETAKCSETYQCPFITTTDESTTFTEISTQETIENQQTTENVETTLNYTEPPKEETTESIEITSQSIEEFTCEVVGSFPNNTDKSCSRYFICKELPNGKFVKTPSKCTKGTYFDPETSKCSETYQCPFIITTDESTTFREISTQETIENVETTINYTEPPKEETTESAVITSQPTEEFTCEVVGSFPNYTDKSCSRYFICKELPNGKFVKTPSQCTKGTYFDPEISKCSETYQCPFIITTDESTTFTEISTQETIENQQTTENVETTLNYTEPPKEETTESAEITLQPTEEFTCEVVGSFPNYTDKSCSRYFICKELSNGKFVKTPSKCTKGTYFDPETAKCSETYQCPFITTTDESTTFTEISTQETIENQQTTENVETTLNYTEPPKEETTESIEITSQPSEEFTCEVVGRFPNNADNTCSQYFLCSQLHNGKFIKTPYECPKGTYFDPEITTCSKSYQCPFIITTGESTSYTTVEILSTTIKDEDLSTIKDEDLSTIEDTTVVTTTIKIEEFICLSTGKYPNLNDETCSSYYLCSRRQNGTFVKTLYNCQGGSLFDPNLKRCSKEFQCSSQLLETTTSVTTVTQWEFSCNKIGRFKNENDSRCKSYFLCSQFRNGTFVRTQYECPNSSIFNAAKHMCSDMISCVQ